MLTLISVSKTFPGVKALAGISFAVRRGEVHALCGENGAGKSTLMNILAGNLQPDPGSRIDYEGKPVHINSVAKARQLGIALVHQERSLIDTLSIADILFANCQPQNRWGLIDRQALNALAMYWLAQLDLPHLHPQTLIADLSPAQKQLVELGKALSQHPQLLILDEPTASLTETEIRTLLRLISALKAAGTSVIYISHRLPEIFAIADTVTVLKDGVHQLTQPIGSTTPDALIRAMVGRDLYAPERTQVAPGNEVLAVERLTGRRFSGMSFQVRRGEIVALAGLVGAGRSEVARAIFGIDPHAAGTVYLNGQPLTLRHPADALRAGIGYVPEERKTQGLFLDMSVQDNILAGVFAGPRRPSATEQAQIAAQFRADLRIQTPSLTQPIRLLSGGNQQKCILARWLHLRPALLIVDEPTHGIDVGAKFDIYRLLRQLAVQGTAILLISSELPEVLALADRILVMRRGQLAGTLPRAEATEEAILSLAS
jgi:ribose transport system ATP-binding protein